MSLFFIFHSWILSGWILYTRHSTNARKVLEFNVPHCLTKLIFSGEDKLTKKELKECVELYGTGFQDPVRTDMKTVS